MKTFMDKRIFYRDFIIYLNFTATVQEECSIRNMDNPDTFELFDSIDELFLM